jgi:hypothetical protein
VANPAKNMAQAVLAGSGLSAAKLGLRFDRVVVRVLRDLRAFADGAVPEGLAVAVTLSAPIRLPAKTVDVLREKIAALLSSPDLSADQSGGVHGNQVRLRLIRQPAPQRPKLVGFVHNPSTNAVELLDLAEHWLLR